MAKKRVSGGLRTAQQFAKLLLWEFTNGNMGTKPEIPLPTATTAGEKRSFLDSLIKIAEIERRASEGEEEESEFEKIQRNIHAGRANGRDGNNGRPAEDFSSAAERSRAESASASTENTEDAGSEGS